MDSLIQQFVIWFALSKLNCQHTAADIDTYYIGNNQFTEICCETYNTPRASMNIRHYSNLAIHNKRLIT